MIYTLLIVIITLICIFLTIAVLLQSGEGGGLSGIAAGGQATQMMGQRRTADFLSKATAILGGSFLILCLIANFFITRGGQTKSTIQQDANATAPANLNMPSKTQSAVPLNNVTKGATQKSTPPANNNQGGGTKKPTGH